jgi:hypothetical protein
VCDLNESAGALPQTPGYFGPKETGVYSSAVNNLIVNAASTVMLNVDAMPKLPVTAHVAAPHKTAARIQSKSVSQGVAFGLEGTGALAKGTSLSNASGMSSSSADFCFSNSMRDSAPLARLASNNRSLFNMADMDPTPISRAEYAGGNGAECGETLKTELVVNSQFENNEFALRNAVINTLGGAH